MKILIVGASKGLGKAFIEGLPADGDTVIGVSRNRPGELALQSKATVEWICADLSDPVAGSNSVMQQAPTELDVVVYNLGIWEKGAFTDAYAFLDSPDEEIVELIGTNVIAAILLLKRLVPRLSKSARPQIVLTGSTSGLPRCGAPEVAFGASKFALRGIADALRESFRKDWLAVTCLQLGDLNTEDPISQPVAKACARGGGSLIPMHDVVDLTRALLKISQGAFVKEIVMPAILDERF